MFGIKLLDILFEKISQMLGISEKNTVKTETVFNKTRKNAAKNDIKFKHNNVVYPNNKAEKEIQKLYDEIKNYNSQDNYKEFNKIRTNKFKENRFIQKQFTSLVSSKEKYKKLEEDFNKLMEKGDDIFVKY